MNQSPKKHMVVHFRIDGPIRFLSHHEMVDMLQRAFTRAGLPVVYSQGYNPRPRMSLPLPRNVGMASEDELLVVEIDPEMSSESWREKLLAQMPEGFTIMQIDMLQGKVSVQPETARYSIALPEDFLKESLQTLEDFCQACTKKEPIEIHRPARPGKRARCINVTEYILSAELKGNDLMFECKITGGGTVRIDEILQAIGADAEVPAGPVRRCAVQWRWN